MTCQRFPEKHHHHQGRAPLDIQAFFEDRGISKNWLITMTRAIASSSGPWRRNLVQSCWKKRIQVILAENSKGYVVKLSRQSRYSAVLKNSLAQIETDEWRIFLMKDLAAVKVALHQGAKLVEVDVHF
jgi:hypothetical protein